MGQTPRQALRDPDRAFNLTVMRAADAARRFKRDLAASGLSEDSDPFGIARIGIEIQSMNEDD